MHEFQVVDGSTSTGFVFSGRDRCGWKGRCLQLTGRAANTDKDAAEA